MKSATFLAPPSPGITLARIFQAVIICFAVGLFVASIPINFEQRSIYCKAEPCPPDQLTPAGVDVLKNVGMSVDSFVSMTIALDILVAAAYTVSAIVIFVRKPNDLFTIFVTIMLVTFGTATFTGGARGVGVQYPQLNWLTGTLALIGNCSLIAFFFVFPNGRVIPRGAVVLLIGWTLFQIPRYYFPDSALNLQHIPAIYNILFPLGILSGIAAQVYRYKRISNPVEQQQTKWVIYGISIAAGGYIVLKLLGLLVTDSLGKNLLTSIFLNVGAILFMLLVPISISIAVLRFRLWDINPIINRTLVYGALSALTIAFYILVVGFFANFFQQRTANFIVSFIATGVVAVLFEPLRKRLQRTVNRLMYGERDDPTTVLMQLSTRLDSALAPDSVLQTIVETLAQSLRLPYAAISLLDDMYAPRFASTLRTSGQAGDLPPSELMHISLTYQNERIGALILAPRAYGESFSTADMNLLNIIAGQAGIAAHNLRLTQDLQRSREKLVTAQEEERRRLRRDLHDGVGPTLASLSQRLGTAADLVPKDPQASVELLKDLKGQVKNTVADIRRLVYALRPPVLDEFGLISSIREHIAPYTGPKGLQVTFDVAESMPPLPAAVEVAAYRIVLEAFTNIINHAEATQCSIRIEVNNGSLLLEVSDNGKGLVDKIRTGVGLTSMRERASELGGECVIERDPLGGTCVRARLPIHKSTATFGLPY